MDFPVLGTLIEVVSEMGALGVSIIVIWALMSERLIPKGRLDEKNVDLAEMKVTLKDITNQIDRLADVHEESNRLISAAVEQRRAR